MEETREFDLAEVMAVRFKGVVGQLVDTDLVSFKAVKKIVCNDFVSILKGVESKSIGFARIYLTPVDLKIRVEGLMDYQSPERLFLENGELSLEYELAIGGPNDNEVKIDDDGKAAPEVLTVRALKLKQCAVGNLQHKKMSWEF